MRNCYGCQAAPGQDHGIYCDQALCPDCGEFSEECPGDDECPGGDSGQPAVWHGIDPVEEVAHQLNWWITPTCIADTSRVIAAIALDQITWDPGTQRYTVGAIDNARLDRELGLTTQ